MRLLTDADNGTGPSVARGQKPSFFTFYAWGTFNGATVRLEVSPDGSAWFDSGIELTLSDVINVEFNALYVRAVVAGGASPSISAEIL